MNFHGKQKGDMVPIKLLILLTLQIVQNGTFLNNSKYDYWILYKKRTQTISLR